MKLICFITTRINVFVYKNKNIKMEVFLYCKGMLILISLGSIRSSRISKVLNQEFLEDLKSLNITGNFQHTQASTGLSLENSRNKLSKLKSSIGKSDSRNYTHAEIRNELETVTTSKDFNVQSLDKTHHVPTANDGHTEQKDISLIPLKGTDHKRVTQENESFDSENKQKGTEHTDNDQNKNLENKNTALTDGKFAEDRLSKEEQISHDHPYTEKPYTKKPADEHPYTEKPADERKETEQEIKPSDETMVPSDQGTAKKPAQHTVERLVKNNIIQANSNTPINNKIDSNHMSEKHIHGAASHVQSTLKSRSKFQFSALTYSTVITESTHVGEQEVKEEMNKSNKSKMSTKPLISIQDKSQNKSVKTNMPEHEENNVFNYTTSQPKTRTELTAPQVQEAKELNVTSEMESEEKNKKRTSTAETLKTEIASKKVNSALSSIKATKDLKTRNVVFHTKFYSTTELTKIIKTTTKQRQLAETEQTNMPHDPGQCADDPTKNYSGSALVAAAVGGVMIGAFAVLLLFHLKQKCRNYINGDYRRVPMEYDFELNPRFKAH